MKRMCNCEDFVIALKSKGTPIKYNKSSKDYLLNMSIIEFCPFCGGKLNKKISKKKFNDWNIKEYDKACKLSKLSIDELMKKVGKPEKVRKLKELSYDHYFKTLKLAFLYRSNGMPYSASFTPKSK